MKEFLLNADRPRFLNVSHMQNIHPSCITFLGEYASYLLFDFMFFFKLPQLRVKLDKIAPVLDAFMAPLLSQHRYVQLQVSPLVYVADCHQELHPVLYVLLYLDCYLLVYRCADAYVFPQLVYALSEEFDAVKDSAYDLAAYQAERLYRVVLNSRDKT